MYKRQRPVGDGWGQARRSSLRLWPGRRRAGLRPVSYTHLRGVDCGAVVQGLVQKSLIEEKGRLELPGRPLLYGTTADFLRSFGLNSLEGLPPLPQKEEENAAMEETTLDDVIEQTETVED